MRTLRDIIVIGLLRGWPGRRCPHCRVRPMTHHRAECPTGRWDGGVWA